MRDVDAVAARLAAVILEAEENLRRTAAARAEIREAMRRMEEVGGVERGERVAEATLAECDGIDKEAGVMAVEVGVILTISAPEEGGASGDDDDSSSLGESGDETSSHQTSADNHF